LDPGHIGPFKHAVGGTGRIEQDDKVICRLDKIDSVRTSFSMTSRVMTPAAWTVIADAPIRTRDKASESSDTRFLKFMIAPFQNVGM